MAGKNSKSLKPQRRSARPAENGRSTTDISVLPGGLFGVREAAQHLGIAAASLYQWLGQSDSGTLVIRGQPVTVDYFQGGAQGQGRIKMEMKEIERLKDLMRVRPHPPHQRRLPARQESYPGITVKLGRPRD
jgi:hypothetical protein